MLGNPGRDTNSSGPGRDIRDDHCSSPYPDAVANLDRPKHARMASKHHMVSKLGHTRFSSGSNGTHLMNCTVRAYSRKGDYLDRSHMGNQHTWPNFCFRGQTDVGHHHNKLSDNN